MLKAVAPLFIGLALSISPALAQQPKPKPEQQTPRERPPKPEKLPKPEKPPRQAPNQNPDATIERIRKALKLSDQQAFQLRPIVYNRNSEITQAYEDDGNATSRRRILDDIQKRFESDLRAILTTSQADRFDHEVLAHPGTFR